MKPRLLDAGDAALTIEFGNAIDSRLLAAVQVLDLAIGKAQASGQLPGLIETMPTFRSLTIFFDPLLTSRVALQKALQPLLDASTSASQPVGRHWCLPVCYSAEFGPDLMDTASAVGVSVEELIALHSTAEYRVCMIGFLPGFPFMDGLPPRLNLPRRVDPRVRVPAGSVAIAGGLAAIYPWESPGGWHLLGRCPVSLFDASRSSPALLAPGDRVRFEPISALRYQQIVDDSKAHIQDVAQWQCGAKDNK